MSETNDIMLSVGIISYNQEKFILRALQSIIEQETNFPFEIIICDDCSTDRTAEVLQPYLEKYQGAVKLISTEKNSGPLKNGENFYTNAKGKYLAWLDADDYLVFPKKFQMQIDFLEKNLEYAGCFHDAAIISNLKEDASKKGITQNYSSYKLYSQFNHYNSDFFPYDLLQRNIIPTASLVFRNNSFEGFFDLFASVRVSTQWALHLYIIKESKFRYFNEAWSVYNDHPEGFTKTINLLDFNLSNISILKTLQKVHYYKYCKLDMNRAILNEYREILYNTSVIKPSKSVFLKYLSSYRKYSIRLFFAERKYFCSLKKINN